jgi:hypothetical protein
MSANFKAPGLVAPRVSILSSAEIVSTPGDRWWGTYEILPLSGNGSSGIFPICDEGEHTAPERLGAQTFTPFAVWAADECSTFGSGAMEFVDRAKQKLAVVEPWWIENYLWENPDAFVNPSFTASPSTVVASGMDPLGAFANLDAAIAQDRHDGRGMIHMVPELFVLLQQYELFRREGNVWYSPLDNIVVPGRGYTGNGPNEDGGANENEATDTVTWMFGHPGIIRIRRSEIMYLPDDDGIAMLKEMDRYINDLKAVAERVVSFEIVNGI